MAWTEKSGNEGPYYKVRDVFGAPMNYVRLVKNLRSMHPGYIDSTEPLLDLNSLKIVVLLLSSILVNLQHEKHLEFYYFTKNIFRSR